MRGFYAVAAVAAVYLFSGLPFWPLKDRGDRFIVKAVLVHLFLGFSQALTQPPGPYSSKINIPINRCTRIQ